MLNVTILTMARRHQMGAGGNSSSRGGVREGVWFLMKTLRLLLLMLMVQSVVHTRSSMAESETNDLNTLETAKPSSMALRLQMPNKVETRQYPNAGHYMPHGLPPFPMTSAGGCPLCDSSVYSYCSHKLIHDSCCCDFPGSIYQKPPQCVYYECSLLYAKTCYEHTLIKNCCCNNPY